MLSLITSRFVTSISHMYFASQLKCNPPQRKLDGIYVALLVFRKLEVHFFRDVKA